VGAWWGCGRACVGPRVKAGEGEPSTLSPSQDRFDEAAPTVVLSQTLTCRTRRRGLLPAARLPPRRHQTALDDRSNRGFEVGGVRDHGHVCICGTKWHEASALRAVS
jgi:hypothetical protein